MDRIDIAAAAKLIRSDIAAAIKSGHLPAIKTSVRVSRYSMGQSLAVIVEAVPAGMDVLNHRRIQWEAKNPHKTAAEAPEGARFRFSTEGALLLAKLEQIVDRHNEIIGMDGSEQRVRRNFHTDVSYGALTRAERERITQTAA